jgi:hypothetical protein
MLGDTQTQPSKIEWWAQNASALIERREDSAMPTAITTVLAYVIAIVGLVLIVAGARDIYLLHIEETFDVTLSDYKTPIRTIAGGLSMMGLAQALRLLLEINVRAWRPSA